MTGYLVFLGTTNLREGRSERSSFDLSILYTVSKRSIKVRKRPRCGHKLEHQKRNCDLGVNEDPLDIHEKRASNAGHHTEGDTFKSKVFSHLIHSA